MTSKTGPGDTFEAIVGTPEWAEANLGGDWVAMPDPDIQDPEDSRRYAGPGHKYDPGIPEMFVSKVWDQTLATTQQQAPDGTWSWEYNTLGELVWHDGRAWRNLLPTGTPNTFPPPTNWREYPLDGGIPIWIQPSGAYDAYPIGFVVKHPVSLLIYESAIAANTTEPGSDERWWTLIGEAS